MSTTLSSQAGKLLSGVTKKYGPSVAAGAKTGISVATTIVVIPIAIAAFGVIADGVNKGIKAGVAFNERMAARRKASKAAVPSEL